MKYELTTDIKYFKFSEVLAEEPVDRRFCFDDLRICANGACDSKFSSILEHGFELKFANQCSDDRGYAGKSASVFYFTERKETS